MAPKHVPPESLPRRRPSGGGFDPITIHVRVNRDGNYLLRHLPETGGPFRDFRDRQDAVRARYADIYLSWHRRRRPLLPPPPSKDDIFQFRYVVEDRVPRRRPTPSAPSLKESPNATTLQENSSGSSTATSSSSFSSRRPDQDTVMASPPSMSSRIWARVRPDWGFIYYVRADLGGSFHTYPHAGGPFQSSEEAESAIDRYLHERRDPTLLVNRGGVPSVEMAIEQALYWPDGRRKKRSKSLCTEQTGNKVRRLVQALVDKHNEDHNLLGDLAYELKDVCTTDNSVEAKKELRRVFTGSDDPNVKTVLWMHPDDVVLEED